MDDKPSAHPDRTAPETHNPQVHTTQQLSTNPGAQFNGSFAVTNRQGPGCDHCLTDLRKQRIAPYFTDGWTDWGIYESALIEGVGAMSLTYMSGLMDVTFGGFAGKWAANWVGVTNIVLLSLFILATAPASGGHLNPLITFGTCLAGLTSVPRAVIYMVAQLAGGAAAGGLMRASFNSNMLATQYNGGGCFFYHTAGDTVTKGQAFVIEMMSSFILLFLAFGCALDPRQGNLFGPVLSPVLVGLALGLTSFASAGINENYAGAGMNPARCFAFGVGRGDFEDQWIWWFGPAAGAILHMIIYRAVPPYHMETDRYGRSRGGRGKDTAGGGGEEALQAQA